MQNTLYQNQLRVLYSKTDTIYVLVGENDRYYAEAFNEPSAEHALYATENISEATKFSSEADAELLITRIASFHVSSDDVIAKVRQEFVSKCKPKAIVHEECFSVREKVPRIPVMQVSLNKESIAKR
jgi:hypothetical protein